MTLTNADGFESRALSGNKWTHMPGGYSTALPHRYNGGGSTLNDNSTAAKLCSQDWAIAQQDSTVLTQWAVGTNNVADWQSYDGPLFGTNAGALTTANWATTGNIMVGVVAGKIVVKRCSNSSSHTTAWANGATLAVCEPSSQLATAWAYFSVAIFHHATLGTVVVKHNDVTVCSLTNQNTIGPAGGATVVGTAYFCMRVAGVGHIDDVVLMNGLGTTLNALQTEARFDWLFPNGNGTYSQLLGSDGNSVNNYQQVDEVIGTAAPNTTDYNGSPTVGNKDTYTLSDLPATVATILFLGAHLYAAKSDTGAKQMCRTLRSGGTDNDGADQNLAPSYLYYIENLLQNPVTAAAWTPAGVNALELGMKVRT